MRPLVDSIAVLEGETLAAEGLAGTVLRYGWFYGAGTNHHPDGATARSIRKGRAPLVGEGAGVYSFIGAARCRRGDDGGARTRGARCVPCR